MRIVRREDREGDLISGVYYRNLQMLCIATVFNTVMLSSLCFAYHLYYSLYVQISSDCFFDSLLTKYRCDQGFSRLLDFLFAASAAYCTCIHFLHLTSFGLQGIGLQHAVRASCVRSRVACHLPHGDVVCVHCLRVCQGSVRRFVAADFPSGSSYSFFFGLGR